MEPVSIRHKLLPTDSIDLLLSATNKTYYKIDGECSAAGSVHFCGLRHKHRLIIQEGVLRVFGISFFPFGLFPFVNQPLTALCGGIVDLKSCNEPLSRQLEAVERAGLSAEATVDAVSEVLKAAMDLSGVDLHRIEQIGAFGTNHYEKSVGLFCKEAAVSQRSFERACLKYTGYTPKTLGKIGRFQAVSNELIYGGDCVSFSTLAYDYDYCDQAHFIWDFQAHTGASPGKFVQEKSSVKENGKVVVMK